jgi:hypothetical protein
MLEGGYFGEGLQERLPLRIRRGWETGSITDVSVSRTLQTLTIGLSAVSALIYLPEAGTECCAREARSQFFTSSFRLQRSHDMQSCSGIFPKRTNAPAVLLTQPLHPSPLTPRCEHVPASIPSRQDDILLQLPRYSPSQALTVQPLLTEQSVCIPIRPIT